MTPLDRGPGLAPSTQSISMVRERLQRLGFVVSEAAAHSLVEAVLSIEGPRLHLQVRGAFENSLEIIRDTAESALGRATTKRVQPPEPPEEEFDEDEPRPVFKRPRR